MKRAFVLTSLTPAIAVRDPSGYKNELRYAQQCLLDSMARGEAPLHGALDMLRLLCDIDADQAMVAALLEAQACWLDASDVCIVYSDLGIAPGMMLIIELARSWDIPVEMRAIPDYAAKTDNTDAAPAHVH